MNVNVYTIFRIFSPCYVAIRPAQSHSQDGKYRCFVTQKVLDSACIRHNFQLAWSQKMGGMQQKAMECICACVECVLHVNQRKW